MEDFNNALNSEQQEETSMVKGIIFAIVGMVIGIIPYTVALGFFDFSFAWIGGLIVGAGISFGWHFGKGPDGILRKVVMIVLSIVAAVLAVWIGASIFFYQMGMGRDFAAAVSMVGDIFVRNIEEISNDFFLILDDEFLILRHFLILIVFSIATTWKPWGSNKNDDLEELDNDGFEELNMNDTVSTNMEMDDALNQDSPILDIDQNWDCAKCGATNRSIVDTCEYCGERK